MTRAEKVLIALGAIGLAVIIANGGCASSRQLTARDAEIFRLQAQLAAARSVPAPMPTPLPVPGTAVPGTEGGLVVPTTVQKVAMWYGQSALPTVPLARKHIVHVFTDDLFVAASLGNTFIPIDVGTGIPVNIGGEWKAIPAFAPLPGNPERDTVMVFLGQPVRQDVTFYCIERQPNGTGTIVGTFTSQVAFGRDGYRTWDTYLRNPKCVRPRR